jgi:hypothetical protein
MEILVLLLVVLALVAFILATIGVAARINLLALGLAALAAVTLIEIL